MIKETTNEQLQWTEKQGIIGRANRSCLLAMKNLIENDGAPWMFGKKPEDFRMELNDIEFVIKGGPEFQPTYSLM